MAGLVTGPNVQVSESQCAGEAGKARIDSTGALAKPARRAPAALSVFKPGGADSDEMMALRPGLALAAVPCLCVRCHRCYRTRGGLEEAQFRDYHLLESL